MFRNQILTTITAGFMLLMGCNTEPNLEVQKMYDEVMAVHDKVMPKMGELNRLKRQLNAFKNTVPDENANLKDSLINSILILSKSEDMMDTWMTNFDYPKKDASDKENLTYLSAQKDSISKVSDDIFMSLAIANGFLNNAPDSIRNMGKMVVDTTQMGN
jgi:hypothetical protein